MPPWEFWIDVGGTFTDCLARGPRGEFATCKVLSSGVTKGTVAEIPDRTTIRDPLRAQDPQNFWNGADCVLFDDQGRVLASLPVADFQASAGGLRFRTPWAPNIVSGMRYELRTGEEAPILAIRTILRLPIQQPIPPVRVRLGTTRGTNALLTRRGAKCGFVTTRGFRDVLLIANQDRPRLFELAIKKPEPLFSAVAEVDERLDAAGKVLQTPDPKQIRTALTSLRDSGCESVAICLLHAFVNPVHEELVARIAAELGFSEVSVSNRLSPLIKIVSRGDTTVMNAYLNPILRDYVSRLQRSLPGSELRLMTSAGGLVSAERFSGKDSVLSGPAGGVIGFSHVARQAGFPRAIGFDMGGTSTDVSRFDGRYDYEFETQKAGVRIVAPMLAIETVAAGGGSICGFDGIKLFVGPQSAGADPGPACYGRGGPLTITDVNLFLGKILPERFPFPLDSQIVAHRLTALCEAIAKSPLGRAFTPHELAEGFVEIANATMARAIRKVSVAKGYDPADYVLVTFGGAGAQHACAIANMLRMKQVLSHPHSGLLSAYGIGLADVRRFREVAVLKPYSSESLGAVVTQFRQLAADLRDEVLAEGVDAERIGKPEMSLDLRYRGIEAVITIPHPADHDFERAYVDRHRQLYGYIREGRPLEIAALRVEVVGRSVQPEEPAQRLTPRQPPPAQSTKIWFGGQSHTAGVFLREDLHPGDEIPGPAILMESSSTVVVDPGFTARILPRGEIVMECSPLTPAHSPIAEKKAQIAVADPVQLEIFNQLLTSIAEQMGVTLQQTAISTNVKERLDFSCAIFDPAGGLVVNAPHIPVHLGAMGETVRCILRDNSELSPGDVFVTNDPFRGGSHLPDITVITPVHDDQTGDLRFLTASRAHHAEVGGIVPGSMPPFSKNLGEEGVLIRNFKLVDRGRSREAELRTLLESGLHPSRSVDDNLADLQAQVAANQMGVRLLKQLIAEKTAPVVEAYMQFVQQAAAEKMKLALSRLNDQVLTRTDHLDDGSPISVTITIQGERATIDFTGTGPVLKTNLNANRAIVNAAVLYVLRCLIGEDIPLNSGVLEPIEIVLPECLLNPPEHSDPAQCPAMVGGNVETSQRVVDVLLGALGLAAASQGTMNNLTFGDKTFGYYETICGGSGATPADAGADAVHTHMTNTRLTDPEVIERRYPVRVREFSIRRSSGGAGAHRGGDGIIRRLEFLAPLRVSLLTERRGPYAPFGLAGGEAGDTGKNTLTRGRGGDLSVSRDAESSERSVSDLGAKASFEVQPGDVLTIETPGGGGYGTPIVSPDATS
ncbi:MAG: hydantoinase B/oxoprolinase family protein [Planctomycetaceae bacterium]